VSFTVSIVRYLPLSAITGDQAVFFAF
jgi:hypothetical protein